MCGAACACAPCFPAQNPDEVVCIIEVIQHGPAVFKFVKQICQTVTKA